MGHGVIEIVRTGLSNFICVYILFYKSYTFNMMGIPLFPLNGPIFQVIHCPRKDDKLWQILSGLSDDAKGICFANTKRRVNKRARALAVGHVENLDQ